MSSFRGYGFRGFRARGFVVRCFRGFKALGLVTPFLPGFFGGLGFEGWFLDFRVQGFWASRELLGLFGFFEFGGVRVLT